MKGKVSGLPTSVPMAEATILPRTIRERMTLDQEVEADEGLNEAKVPVANPAATACGVALRRSTRLPK